MNSNSKFLRKKLALPVGAAIVICLILAYFTSKSTLHTGAHTIPWSGLFINIATTFLGVLITVFYVDLILKQQNEIRWKKVKSHCTHRITRIANLTILDFRTAFKISLTLDSSLLKTDNQNELRSHLADHTETILIPSFAEKINQLTQKDWEKLMQGLKEIIQLTERTFDMYANNIDPEILECVLEIQDKANSIFSIYEIYHIVFGIAAADFPAHWSGTSLHQKSAYSLVIIETTEMLQIASTLLRRLNQIA